MDLFTHVIFAYLLSFVIWGPSSPQYIAAGALAGGLPDGDAFLFLLARRFPMFRHHGITHSIFGVTVIAAAGAFIVPHLPYFTAGSTLLFFVAMLIGGLTHVVLDGFTEFAVPPLLPFSWRELQLDADTAINIVMMGITLVSLVTLIEEHGRVAFNAWIETAWILVAVYGGYLLIRSTARWRIGIVRRRKGFGGVIPTTNPLDWVLVEAADTAERYRIRFLRYELGRGPIGEEHRLDVGKSPIPEGPVHTAQEALDRSYGPARESSWFMGRWYHFGEAVEQKGCWEVAWFPVGIGGARGFAGVKASVDSTTGAVTVRSGFRRPTRPAES